MATASDPVAVAGIRWLLPYERRLVRRNIIRWQTKLEAKSPGAGDVTQRKVRNVAYAWLAAGWSLPAFSLMFGAIVIQSLGSTAIVALGVPAGIAWFFTIWRITQAFRAYPHNVPFP